MKPDYERDGVTLYCGDCLDVLPTCHSDGLFADPPYGVKKAGWDDRFASEWLGAVPHSVRVAGITPGILNLLRLPQTLGTMQYRWLIVAYLANSMTRSAFGYGKHIPCAIYAADGVSLYRKHRDLEKVNVRDPHETMPDHPCPKPTTAMRYFVESLPCETVLDPFMGSGTTGVACVQTGRKFIGIEKERKYFDIAVARIEKAIAEKAEQLEFAEDVA